MPVTNDFLPFATGSGANVLTPSTWATVPDRFTGFQSGTASSAKANTALRQVSSITAMIAQFISDTLAQSVTDNGNLATLEAQFISAIQLSVGSVPQAALWHFGHDTGPVNVMQVAASPIITAYADGMMLATLPQFSNTTSNPTLSANGLASTVIVHADGTALDAGDIAINTVIIFAFDASLSKWRIISQTSIPQAALAHFGVDIGSANAMSVGTTVPPVTVVSTGMHFTIQKSTAANTGSTTLTIAGTAAVLTWGDGTAFVGGEWPANATGEVVYNGNYRLLGPPSPPPAVSQASQVHYGADTGSANLVVAMVAPVITSYVTGSTYWIKILAANTGAATMNLNGIGSRPIVLNKTGAALSGSELKVGTFHEFVFDGTSMRLDNSAATTAVQNIISITTTGTYMPTAGIRAIRGKAWAGGGAGRSVTTSSFFAGDGGGAGEYREGVFLITPGAGISVTIGLGGGPGVDGGDTIVGSLITAKGGKAATGHNGAGPGLGGTSGTGGFGFPGGRGIPGYTAGDNAILFGNGGASFGASQTGNITSSTTPTAGIFPGGGGGGGNGGPGPGSILGGPGAAGLVLIEEIP